MRLHVKGPSQYMRLSGQDAAIATELQHVRSELPGMKVIITFGDDIPYCEELFILRERAQRMRKKPTMADRQLVSALVTHRMHWLSGYLGEQMGDAKYGDTIARACHKDMPGLAFGFCCNDGVYYRHKLRNNTGDLLLREVQTPPQNAFILLPPRSFDTVCTMSYLLGLSLRDCEHNNSAPAWISNLHHETGHLKLARASQDVIPWIDEMSADANVLERFTDLNRPDLNRNFLYFRALTNFTGEMSYSASKYWNLLVQGEALPLNAKGIVQDKASTLEVKQRAASWLRQNRVVPPVCALPKVQLDKCLNARSHQPLRDIFDLNFTSPLVRKIQYHALQRVVDADVFTYPESRELAQATLAAAQTLLPVVMNEARKYTKYLHKTPQAV